LQNYQENPAGRTSVKCFHLQSYLLSRTGFTGLCAKRQKQERTFNCSDKWQDLVTTVAYWSCRILTYTTSSCP